MEPNNILEQLAGHLKKALQTELSVQTRVASGALIGSIDTVVGEAVGGFEIVGSALRYAKYVERGRRAGAKGVPLDALIEWIRTRRIAIEGRSERSTAFMIQNSIRRKGIAPTWFITRTLERSADKIEHDVRGALAGMVAIRIETLFNDITQTT